ncbi:type II toxin-antitoxin system PemK/MazF family toxin [Candidatus Amesbacteria bacterium]|nr:type II toxin-antitoxin system PemK/MazF family toxin [Candidatus Amesbacteria bacterium]
MYKIVLVRFPFTEKAGYKLRPALMLTDLHGKYNTVLVAYITSKDSDGSSLDIKIKQSKKNKLSKDLYINIYKITNIVQSALKGELGELTDNETKEVKTKLKKMFEL